MITRNKYLGRARTRTRFHFEILISSHWLNYILYYPPPSPFSAFVAPRGLPFFSPFVRSFFLYIFLCPTGHFAYFAVGTRILKRRSHRIITHARFELLPPSPCVPATLAISSPPLSSSLSTPSSFWSFFPFLLFKSLTTVAFTRFPAPSFSCSFSFFCLPIFYTCFSLSILFSFLAYSVYRPIARVVNE